ncbi:MAG: rod shape-determining protein, partial [Christensenellaceae bacterium]|nr:rod shape-determining protein [Christensenellaceae bacterium]
GFDRLLTERTKIPCYVADDAVSCVAIGTGISLENMGTYHFNSITDYRRGDYYGGY